MDYRRRPFEDPTAAAQHKELQQKARELHKELMETRGLTPREIQDLIVMSNPPGREFNREDLKRLEEIKEAAEAHQSMMRLLTR